MWDWTGSGSALGPKWTRWSPPPFVWQAWHLVTSTVTLAWQAWHLWDWTGSGVRPHNLSRLVHTTCPHTTCRHTCVAHANPSPSLFSFPHFPSHLYLSFASYWKKLTCGVVRSFNFNIPFQNNASLSLFDLFGGHVSLVYPGRGGSTLRTCICSACSRVPCIMS